MSSQDISSTVQASLRDSKYTCISLEKLSGGTANYVFRGVLAKPLELDGSKTIVIKHTPPYVAAHPDFKLTATRCEFEECILSALHTFDPSPALNTGISVQTPRLYHFFQDTNTQIYSDLPASTSLKNYALEYTLDRPQSLRMGRSLGLWAKEFHQWAQEPAQEKLRETMKGNTAMKELKFRINYETLLAKIEKFPEILNDSRSVFQEVRDDARKRFDTEDEELIHGDFWSGNIVIPNKPLTEEHVLVYVVDWELSYVGSIEWDLGQMFAELFELKHFKDINAGLWLIEGFMDGYGAITEDLAFKTAIHTGNHLVCWGTGVAGWGNKEQVEGVAAAGRDFIVNGWNKDKQYFKDTALACLFK